MDFAEIVLRQLKALDLNINQAELGRGLPQGYIRGVVRDDEKRAVPNVHKAEQIAKALGLEFYIGPPRDTGPVEQVILDGREFAHIPLHRASLAAGGGSQNDGDEIIDQLAFRRSWLTKIGISASNAVLARARGDSMQPAIHEGDMLLIDRSKSAPPQLPRGPRDTRPAPIYALLDDYGARVKRIERAPGGTLALLSDNPAYAPEFRSVDSVQIIGKVMWWGHTNRE